MRPLNTTSRRATVLLAAATLAALTAVQAGPAQADTSPPSGTPATVSADALPTWQVNGVVWSMAVVGTTVYATGSFSKARPPGVAAGGTGEVDAGNLFAFDITTGNRVSSFNHSLNAQGRVVTASPDGSRVYVGGDFTTVDGAAHGHVAAFKTADGTLDAGFTANVSNTVRALASNSTTLFIGGGFGNVNGKGRDSLAAVNNVTGAVTSWRPVVDNGEVWSMTLTPDGTKVIVGGSFTTLSGQSAYGMGALSVATGAVLQWDANQTIRNATSSGAITSLRADSTQVYGSGYAFGSGSNFEGTFAADQSTGRITLVNDCHGDTYDVLPLGAVLYSVSHTHDCTPIGSFPDTSPRVRWQHALAQTITPTTTNKGPDSYGWNYNGLPASTVLHWFPQLARGSYTGQSQAAWALAGNSTYVVMGGEFPKVNGVAQQGLVRMAVSGTAPNTRGPTYNTTPSRTVPATTATSSSAGKVTVTFGTAWDYDNELLTYDIYRNGSKISTRQVKTNFWTLPTQSFTDSGLTSGSTHYYQVQYIANYGS